MAAIRPIPGVCQKEDAVNRKKQPPRVERQNQKTKRHNTSTEYCPQPCDPLASPVREEVLSTHDGPSSSMRRAHESLGAREVAPFGTLEGVSSNPTGPIFYFSNQLDFKSPWPVRLTDPDNFANCLDNFAREIVDGFGPPHPRLGPWGRLASFVFDFIPFYKCLPEPLQEVERLALGDWHKYLRRVQGLAAFYQPQGGTAYRRHRAIVPAAPQLLRLEEILATQEKQAGAISEEQWGEIPPAEGLMHIHLQDGPGFVVAPANGGKKCTLVEEIRASRAALSRISSVFGAPQAWVKRPNLSTCRALVMAWGNGEMDSEEFLARFRERDLGLHGDELDAYLAQVLLGMQVSGGALIVTGDMTVRFRRGGEMNLAEVPESELCEKLIAAARGARRKYEYDGRRDSKGNMVSEECYLDPRSSESAEILFLDRIDQASWRVSTEPDIRNEYEDWEKTLKSAGLSPSQRRALILRKNGQITSRENADEWKRGERAIRGKRSELVRAIEAANRKRIVKSPQISAGNDTGVVRDGASFVLALSIDDEPRRSITPEPRSTKWFERNPPPISATVRKTKSLFKKVSTSPRTL